MKGEAPRAGPSPPAGPSPTARAAASPLKRLELGWKSLWFRGVFRYLVLRPAPPLPNWKSQPRRVLFIRPDGIGDAIASVRLFESVARLSPQLRVDVLGSPANASFLERLDYLNEVLVFNRRKRGALPRLARELRRRHYDAVIDCRLLEPSLTGLLLMLASGAPHRIGIGSRGVDPALTYVVPRASGHVTKQLTLLGPPFGLSPEEVGQRPRLTTSAGERAWADEAWGHAGPTGRRLLVNVSAGEAPRTWPEERFIRVIREVAQLPVPPQVRVIGSPAEAERIQSIAEGAGVESVRTPTFGHVIALVEASDVVLSPDTSVVHVAAAFSRPTVALYLQGTASQWGAYEVPGANIESPDRTLDPISVEQVLRHLTPLLTGG